MTERTAKILQFIKEIKNLSPEELIDKYIQLKEEADFLNECLQYLRKKILSIYNPGTQIQTPTHTVKIIKTKRKILDQKALKDVIDITPYLKEQEITLIQVKKVKK